MSVRICARSSPWGIASSEIPWRDWIRQRIPAIRSLMQLIALRGTGISENRRKLYAVGFGITSPAGPYELKMEGNGSVRRFFSAVASEEDEPADTPAIR